MAKTNCITLKTIYICDGNYSFDNCEFFEKCEDKYWCKFRSEQGRCMNKKALEDFMFKRMSKHAKAAGIDLGMGEK